MVVGLSVPVSELHANTSSGATPQPMTPATIRWTTRWIRMLTSLGPECLGVQSVGAQRTAQAGFPKFGEKRCPAA
ncbi:putative uncharacterized protein [Mycolicibacterium thermoresistibile]|uniref:Uncharacterized protein n=1 Tax=Mycolicibacterium thermoresistibile TaxID=1797 RepID=A0A117IMQ5_MYCTH|nr:putative uncharacterized protein [Mycolicibacterium thermoresistibile]